MQLVRSQQGDTLIEVIVAFTVFAVVAVGALTIMNQGTTGAQSTLETTLVRQQVDNQAEMIRYIHQAYLANPTAAAPSPSASFRDIIDLAKSAQLKEPSEYGSSCTQILPDSDGRFMLNDQGGMLDSAEIKSVQAIDDSVQAPYAQLDGSTSYGMWIEPVISNDSVDSTSRYVDFHIRACWESASSAPQRTLGTIVRLYVPDNIATGTGSL